MTNPDAPLDSTADALAEAGAPEDQIAGAAQGFATVFDANGPFGPPDGTTLPTLPSLPNGYDWRVVLRDHNDSNNLTDHGEDWTDYDWQGWYWEDGRPICGHRLAIVYLRQNTVVLHQRSVQVEGLDTEFEFVSAVVRAAERLYSDNDFNRNSWLSTDFAGLQEASTPNPTVLAVAPTSLTLSLANTPDGQQLTVLGDNGVNYTVLASYTSSDDTIATVSTGGPAGGLAFSGMVAPVAIGTATVTVSYTPAGGTALTATVAVTVTA